MIDIANYMNLPYAIILRPDEEGDFIASVQELPGCIAHGANEREAIENLRVVQEAWIRECVETGKPIPQPEQDEELPSGKWVQRVPRTLHKRLTEMAAREEVSLNQLVTSMLSESVATRSVMEIFKENLGSSMHGAWYPEASISDPWDNLARSASGGWCVYQARPGAALLESLNLVEKLAAVGPKKQSYILTDAYTKEIAEYANK